YSTSGARLATSPNASATAAIAIQAAAAASTRAGPGRHLARHDRPAGTPARISAAIRIATGSGRYRPTSASSSDAHETTTMPVTAENTIRSAREVVVQPRTRSTIAPALSAATMTSDAPATATDARATASPIQGRCGTLGLTRAGATRSRTRP